MKKLILIFLLLSNLAFSQYYIPSGINWGSSRGGFGTSGLTERQRIFLYFANDSYKNNIDTLRLQLLDSLGIVNLKDWFKQIVIGGSNDIIVDLTGKTSPAKIGNVDYDDDKKGWYHIDTSVHGYINSTLTTHSWADCDISFGYIIAQNYSSNKCYDFGAFYAIESEEKIMGLGNFEGISYFGIQSEHTAKTSTILYSNPLHPMIIGCTRYASDSTADRVIINNGSEMGFTYYEQHPVDSASKYPERIIPITCLNYETFYGGNVFYTYRRIGGWWFGEHSTDTITLRKINNCLEYYRKAIGKPCYYYDIKDTVSMDTSANRFIARIETLTTFNDSDRTGIWQLFRDLKDSLNTNDIATIFKRFSIYGMGDSIQAKMDWTWHNTDMTTIGSNTFTNYEGWTTGASGCLNTGFKSTLSNNPFTRVSNSWGIGVYSNTNVGFCFGVILSAPNNKTEGIATRTGGSVYWYTNSTFYGVASANSIGSYTGVRTDTNTSYFYKNGVYVHAINTGNEAGALMDFYWYVGNMNDDGAPYATGYTGKAYLYDYEGKTLGSNDVRKIYNCIKKYYARKGKTI